MNEISKIVVKMQKSLNATIGEAKKLEKVNKKNNKPVPDNNLKSLTKLIKAQEKAMKEIEKLTANGRG